MVDIECTRCGATGTDYPTNFVAKFSLKHETGCGARLGIPKYSDTTKVSVTIDSDPKVETTTETKKLKKKTTKKKKVETY